MTKTEQPIWKAGFSKRYRGFRYPMECIDLVLEDDSRLCALSKQVCLLPPLCQITNSSFRMASNPATPSAASLGSFWKRTAAASDLSLNALSITN